MLINYERAKRNGPKLKAQLTRALHVEGDPERRTAVVNACRCAVEEWGAWGCWPDNWSHWQRALDDAAFGILIQDLWARQLSSSFTPHGGAIMPLLYPEVNVHVTISLPAHAAEKLAVMGSAELTNRFGFDVQAVKVLTDHQRTKRVNDALYEIGRTYHDKFPYDKIGAALDIGGFRAMDEGDYQFIEGASGRYNFKVGQSTWLAVSWYTMPSGRLEIIAYVS